MMENSNTPLKLAILSTPRTGNTWIRHVLGSSLNLNQHAVHNYQEIAEPLNQRTLVATHWPREPHFQKWLNDRDFIKLTIARNPFDVFVSVLHFARKEPQVHRWLEGNVEIPASFLHVSPASKEFLEYCLSFGAENLLSITYQWWFEPKVIQLRYEDCVANPKKEFGTVIEQLGGDASNLDKHLEPVSLENMKKHANNHGWKATPEHYKKFIPPLNAWKIYQRHKQVFKTLGYDFKPYFLSQKAAEKNWQNAKVN
jgi:Sulfotransferase domain